MEWVKMLHIYGHTYKQTDKVKTEAPLTSGIDVMPGWLGDPILIVKVIESILLALLTYLNMTAFFSISILHYL